MDRTITFEEIGVLDFWDPNPFLKAADILVAGDEPLLAIELLSKNLPGYYRDHPPQAFTDKINKIRAKLATPSFYINNPDDDLREDVLERSLSPLMNTFRGVEISKDVKIYNNKGIIPHIIDLGPGEYWLALGMMQKELKFTYQGIGLCASARNKAEQMLRAHLGKPKPNVPNIFVACELIEHLHHEEDIAADCFKICAKPDIIHMSTPKYTFDTRQERINWENCGELGHLRTYTPFQFMKVVCEMFREYTWVLTDSQILHMRGTANAIR